MKIGMIEEESDEEDVKPTKKPEKRGKLDDDSSSQEEDPKKKKSGKQTDLLGMEEPVNEQPKSNDLMDDLLGFGLDTQPVAPSNPITVPAASNDLLGDLMGDSNFVKPAAQPEQDLIGDSFLQPQNQPEPAIDFGNDDPFGQNQFEEQEDNNEGAGWDAFGEETASKGYNLELVRRQPVEVLSSSTPGNKQKKSGLGVSAAVNFNSSTN